MEEADATMLNEVAAAEGGLLEGASEEPVAAADQPLDKLTALEMLQVLKEYKKRELLYVFQITSLQKELQLQENAFPPTPCALAYHNSQAALLDPAVNLEVRELRLRLLEKETELQKARDELKASTFSADSVMGRRLINKCKALQEENTDIGKMLLENQLQPLQLQIGILQKQLAFFKKQLAVLHQLNADLDRDNQYLVRQLHELTALYKDVQLERDQLKSQVHEYCESAKHRDMDSGYSPRGSSRDRGRDRSDSRHVVRRSSRKRSAERLDDDHTVGGGGHVHPRSESQTHRTSRRKSPSSRSSRREGERSSRRRERSSDGHSSRRSRSNGGGDSRRRRNDSPSLSSHHR